MLDALYDRFAYQKMNDNPGPFEYGIPDSKLEENRKNKPGSVPSFERSKESRSLPLVVNQNLINIQKCCLSILKYFKGVRSTTSDLST